MNLALGLPPVDIDFFDGSGGRRFPTGPSWLKRKYYNMQLFTAAWFTGSPDMADQVIDFFGLTE
jgi:hypothetical protein